MSSKIDKEMLKNPDVFISTSDHIFNYIEHHFKTAVAIVGIAVVASLAYVGYNYMQAAKEQRAAEALYQPEAALKKAESDVREQRAKAVQALAGGKAEKPAKVEAMQPPDYAKDFAPHVEQLKEKLRSYGDTKAALVSALNLSYFLHQQKQFPQALEVLDLPKYKPAQNELLNGFWLMHKGVTLLENQKVDGAMEAYQSVLKIEALKPFHPEALLKLGVCYELKGDAAKAREMYEKLSHEYPRTEASQSAQQYLRLLDLKTQQQG